MVIPDEILNSDERAIFALRALYRKYGYTQYKMSKFEEYDLYAGNKSFLVSDNVITFTDGDGRLMALKPDVTLSIVKGSPESIKGLKKVCYNENVYRIPKGGATYKETMQNGLECIGEVDRECVAEVVTLAQKSLELISPDYALDISHLGLLNSALERTNAPDDARRRLLQCAEGRNPHGIDAICASERIPCENVSALKTLVASYGAPGEVIPRLKAVFDTPEEKAMIDDTEALLSSLPAGKVNLDFSIEGDMSYYNGFVFKGFVNGLPSALLSGGQYDNLMRRMGKSSRAVGFAIYLDLLELL